MEFRRILENCFFGSFSVLFISIRLTRSFHVISFKICGKHQIFVLFPNSLCSKSKSSFQNFLALKDAQEAMVKKRMMTTVEKCWYSEFWKFTRNERILRKRIIIGTRSMCNFQEELMEEVTVETDTFWTNMNLVFFRIHFEIIRSVPKQNKNNIFSWISLLFTLFQD